VSTGLQLDGRGAKVERLRIDDGTDTGYRWLILTMAHQTDIEHSGDFHLNKESIAWVENREGSAPKPMASLTNFYNSSKIGLGGNFTLRFPWSQVCSERTGGVLCENVSTRPLPHA
jgi:hypothetical protein